MASINGKRNALRKRVALSAEYCLEGQGEWIPCEIYDVSEDGAGIRIRQLLEAGDVIRIRVPDWAEELPELEGEIVHSKGLVSGVEWDLEPAERRKLMRLID